MWIKINKTTARKVFNAGKRVFVLPCKCKVENLWGIGSLMEKSETIPDFDEFINRYETYNCNNELGKRCAYYADREVLLQMYIDNQQKGKK